MKRWIHASTKDTIRRISEAKRALGQYTDEQIQYVKECQDELASAISDSYFDENGEFADEDRPIGSQLSEIKRDYMVGAIEDDLMTEEEFEDIMALLDVVSLELTAPHI